MNSARRARKNMRKYSAFSQASLNIFTGERIPAKNPESAPEAAGEGEEKRIRIDAAKFEFIPGHRYTIVTPRMPGVTSHHRVENECLFEYVNKTGRHHVFREIYGNWTRCYTDAQLIGKEIREAE